MKISVCIPTLNRSSIEYCLNAINNQTRLPDEILQSTLKPLHNALSDLINRANYDIIVILDDDIEIQKDFLENVEKAFGTNNNIGFVCGSMIPNPITRLEKAISELQTDTFVYGSISFRYKQHNNQITYADETKITGVGAFNAHALKKCFKDNHIDTFAWEMIVSQWLKDNGYVIVYNPNLSFNHKPRNSYTEYAKQLFVYGTGRCKYLRLYPDQLISKWYFLCPLVLILTIPISIIAYLPYILAISRLDYRKFLLIMITHFSYGLGFLKGLIR